MAADIPQAVVALMESVRLQSGIMMAVSGAGTAWIVHIWEKNHAAACGDDVRFRQLLCLCVPLACFAVVYYSGFLIHSAFSGYAAEVMQGYPTGEKVPIANAADHFKDDYFDRIQSLTTAQFCASIAGIFVIFLWLILNLWSRRRMK